MHGITGSVAPALRRLNGSVLLVAVALLAAAAHSVRAGEAANGAAAARVLVELFTSQGCSSCPAADRLFSRIAGRDDVVAISYAVDYWDYLGWRDTLASHANSERQRRYAERLGEGMVYTPQLVVDGLAHVNGADEKAVASLIDSRLKARAAHLSPARLTLAVEGDRLRITVEATGEVATAPPQANLWLAEVSRRQTVEVRGGENSGRSLVYYHISRDMMPIGEWTGQPLDVSLPRGNIMSHGGDGCVVILQEAKGGQVLAAADYFDR